MLITGSAEFATFSFLNLRLHDWREKISLGCACVLGWS